MQIVVTGMHRSGTSAVARILNLMGAYFGPEGSGIGAGSENPKGFWERRDVRDLNDSVLASFGADWDRPLRLDLNNLDDATQERFDRSARSLIVGMDANRPWFIKEPRISLLYQLWKAHLEVPQIVIVFRHPLEVAKSLEDRNGFPTALGLALWEYYNVQLIRQTAGVPRVLVGYHELTDDPLPTVRRLFEELSSENKRYLSPPSDEEVMAFVDARLKRHSATEEEHALLSESQTRLWAYLNQGDLRVDDPPTLARDSRRLLHQHDWTYREAITRSIKTQDSASVRRILRGHSHEMVQLRSELLDCQDELDAVRERYHAALDLQDETAKSLAETRVRNDRLSERNGRLEGKIEDLGATLEESGRQLDTLRQQRDGNWRRHSEAKAALKSANDRLTKAESRKKTVETVLRNMETSRSWKLAKTVSRAASPVRKLLGR